MIMKKKLILLLFLGVLFSTSSLHARKYYWVKDAGVASGDMSQVSHWATTSGNSGGGLYATQPGASDTLIFDANSGFTTGDQTITITQDLYCAGIIFDGCAVPPILEAASGKVIRNGGGLLLQREMTVNADGAILEFTSSNNDNAISTNGVVINCAFRFTGSGSWTVMDSLTLWQDQCYNPANIEVSNGKLIMDDQVVSCHNFSATAFGKVSMLRTVLIPKYTSHGLCNGMCIFTSDQVLTSAETEGSSIIINFGDMITKLDNEFYNLDFTYSTPLRERSVSGGIYNRITYHKAPGKFAGNITTDSLMILASGPYYFDNKTITVKEHFEAKPLVCGSVIELQGSGTIAMGPTATNTVENCRISNLTITGNTPYNATSSIDAGGNTGWNITGGTGTTYYWVDGSGNWYDLSHWSLNSGGTGGGVGVCIPTPFDNVIFDDNSGFAPGYPTVTVDKTAYCDSMSWLGTTNPPTFSHVGVEIHGSLVFQNGMTAGGDYTFLSNRPGESITSNGVAVDKMEFRSSQGTGGWVFQDDITSSISFFSGHLNTNGKEVSGYTFASEGNLVPHADTRSLIIANSTLKFSNWNYTGGIPLSADSSINSLINSGLVIAKQDDIYYNVEGIGNYEIWEGYFNKITLTTARSGNLNFQETDSLIFDLDVVASFGRDLYINEYFATKPECGGLTKLHSDGKIIYVGNAEVKVSDLEISRANINGNSVPYTTERSVDIGTPTSTGWYIPSPSGTTYYWIGGDGDWSESSHWALSSNGSANVGGCIPGPYDNVIFDDNSGLDGYKVTTTVFAYCDSMTWKGSITQQPTFSMGASFYLGGSLTLQRGMEFNGSDLHFVSDDMGETVTTNGVTVNTICNFNGTGGWNLTDSLTIPNIGYASLVLQNGNLDFNGQVVTLYQLDHCSSTGNPNLNIAGATINITTPYTYGGCFLTSPRDTLTAAESAGSTIICTSSGGLHAKEGDIYHNVIFNHTGLIENGVYNSVTFKGHGTMNRIETDTLIFTPGAHYTFLASDTVKINKDWLYISGNTCLRTELLSSSAGTTAWVSIPLNATDVEEDTLRINFVTISDIGVVQGTDKAGLHVGDQNIDKGGCVNVRIDPAGSVGFYGFGPDMDVACLPLPVNTDAFYTTPITTVEWYKDSIQYPSTVLGRDREYLITSLGTYWVVVDYAGTTGCRHTASRTITGNDSIAPLITVRDTTIYVENCIYENTDTLLDAQIEDCHLYQIWYKLSGMVTVDSVPNTLQGITFPLGVTHVRVYANDTIPGSWLTSGVFELANIDSADYDITILDTATKFKLTDVTVCSSMTVDLYAQLSNVSVNDSVTFYSNRTLTSPVTATQFVITGDTMFYARSIDTVGLCHSSIDSIKLTVIPSPSASLQDTLIPFVSGGSVILPITFSKVSSNDVTIRYERDFFKSGTKDTMTITIPSTSASPYLWNFTQTSEEAIYTLIDVSDGSGCDVPATGRILLSTGTMDIFCHADTMLYVSDASSAGVYLVNALPIPKVDHFTGATEADTNIIKIHSVPSLPALLPLGQHTITWIARDVVYGLSDTCEQLIRITTSPCGTDSLFDVNGNYLRDTTVVMVDADGNIYNTVRVGCACFTDRNLISTTYTDGTTIERSIYYANMYPDTTANKLKYGYLYTWDAANHTGSTGDICPPGWRLPLVEEYECVIPYGSEALRKPNEWLSDNTATNTTGFTALPGGYYDTFLNMSTLLLGDAFFWTSTSGKVAHIRYPCPVLQIEDMYYLNSTSVRCVKE